MNNYIDITSIVQRLDKLFLESGETLESGNLKCKSCGGIYALEHFPLYKHYNYSCQDCLDWKTSKNKLYKELKSLLINQTILKKVSKIELILNSVFNCDNCRFHKPRFLRKQKFAFSPIEQDVFISCQEQERVDRCDFRSVYLTNIKDKLLYNEDNRVKEIIDNLLTDDYIKIKVLLLKLTRKINNYDASKC